MKYKGETIILIEYLDNVPFSVITEYKSYDVNIHAAGWLMLYESGGRKFWKDENGKKIINIGFMEYCRLEAWKIWVDSQYELIPENIQQGVTLIKKPIMLPDYIDGKLKKNNPFMVGEEVSEIYYCEWCDAYYTENGCPEHGNIEKESKYEENTT